MNRLSSGLGIWQIISTNIITDIISKAGFDMTLIDFEHGLNDSNSLQNMFLLPKVIILLP